MCVRERQIEKDAAGGEYSRIKPLKACKSVIGLFWREVFTYLVVK